MKRKRETLRLMKEECRRIVKSPFIGIVCITFLCFNIFLIYNYAGEEEKQEEFRRMHDVVLIYDAASGDEMPGEIPSRNMKDGQEEMFIQAYSDYVDTYGSMYDKLDMMSVLRQKKKQTGYEATGAYGDFIENNYKKLQMRVEEIKRTGEGEADFYPGLFYEVFGMLYGSIGKKLLLEMVVLMLLCVLMLMDYERVHKTRDVVLTTKTGKKVMKIKAAAGIICGLLYSMILMAGTNLYFFSNVPLKRLWQVPVSSAVMAEKRNMMLYPFITFWKITFGQYFVLTIIVLLVVALLAGILGAGLQMILQNSYFAFLAMCLIYMGCYLLAFCNNGTVLDLIGILLNPASLWITCGAWFMENDLTLSFAGNEFWCIGGSGLIAVLVVWLGKIRYKRLEV